MSQSLEKRESPREVDGLLRKFCGTLTVSEDRLEYVLRSGILHDVFHPGADLENRSAVRTALRLHTPFRSEFQFKVNWEQSLREMRAAGRYDWVSDEVMHRFPICEEGQRSGGTARFEAGYVHFDFEILMEDVLKQICQADLQNLWWPARIEHLLAFGALYMNEQEKFPILGLGSVAKIFNQKSVPALSSDGSDRIVKIYSGEEKFPPKARFLVCRRVVES